MQIEQTAQLSPDQLTAAQTLLAAVQAADGSARDPYLSNQFNVDLNMPAFFLAYADAALVGLVTLYADEAPGGLVDVTINVHPNCRRRGIASQLWQAAAAVLRQAGYDQVEFITEQGFLAQAPAFATHNQLQREAEFEYQLAAPAQRPEPVDPAITVAKLQPAEIAALLPAYCEAFPEVAEAEARRYLETNLHSEHNAPYVGHYQGQIIGYCGVDYGTYDYLFGLFIAAPFRGQGLGQRFLAQLMVTLAHSRRRALKLGVENTNPAALHVYQKAEFQIETTVYYLTPQAGSRWGLKAD